MAKIDIIVPVYNVEAYLERCVDSLLNQTFRDIRILLVDDGSTDSSPLICDKYAEKYDNIEVVHKKNGGQSSARNRGLKMITSDYVMFLDSDDYFENTACEKAYTAATRENADIVAFGIKMIDAVGNEKSYEARHLPIIYRNFFESNSKELFFYFGHIVNKLYRREVLSDLFFPEELIYEDYYWGCVITPRIKKIHAIKESLYCYCENASSTTHSPSPKHKFDKFKIMDKVIEEFKTTGQYDEYYEYIEYLYTKFCFVNGSKSAVLAYKNPKDVVLYARKMIKEKFPLFRKNRYYTGLNNKKERLLVEVLFYFPRIYIWLAHIKKAVLS